VLGSVGAAAVWLRGVAFGATWLVERRLDCAGAADNAITLAFPLRWGAPRRPRSALDDRLCGARSQAAFANERWQGLAERGATKQRCLWASTSAKDPNLRDTHQGTASRKAPLP
jgi:hypothetical protein